jgi:hypothetical protein
METLYVIITAIILIPAVSLCVRFAVKVKNLRKLLLLKELELSQKDMRYDAALVEWVKTNKRKNGELAALISLNGKLSISKVRLSRLVKMLRLREDPVTLAMTWFKTPDTDERVCKVRVREQLAIELENEGVIKYKVSENYREDLKETEITVTAIINTINLKYDGRTEEATKQD